MKRVSREVKIGLAFLVSFVLLYVGVNFMKGCNVFSKYNTYYIVLKNTGGIAPSSVITANGYPVGIVENVEYDYNAPARIVVTLRVNRALRLPKGSRAVVVGSLMDGASVSLSLAQNSNYYVDGDTIATGMTNGLMGKVENVMLPQINAMIPKIDSLVTVLTALVSNPALTKSLDNVESISRKLDNTATELDRLFHAELPQLMETLQGAADNVHNITSDVSDVDVVRMMAKVDSTITNLQTLSAVLLDDHGSVGRLLNDTAFYNNLNSVCTNANALIEDVKKHPSRYINISVFGRKADK